MITVKDHKTVARGRDNVCPKFPEICSLPAGGKYSPGSYNKMTPAAEADIVILPFFFSLV